MESLNGFPATIKPATAAETLMSFLRGLDYSATARLEALTYFGDHDSVLGCPSVDDEDQPAAERLIRAHDAAPATWGPETDADRWVPFDAVSLVERGARACRAEDELRRLGAFSAGLADTIAGERRIADLG